MVEARGAWDRVTRAGEDGTLGAEALLEDVADGVECRMVRTRDDELGERSSLQNLERNLRFVGRALDQRCTRTGFEAGRQRIGQVDRAANER